MKKIFAAFTLLIALFANNINAQSTKLIIKKSWIVAKPQVAGAVQINPETGEEGNAVSHQLFVYLMLKKGTKPVYQNAVFNKHNIPVLIEDKGEKIELEHQKKSSKSTILQANKGYSIWKVTLLDLVQDTINANSVLKISLRNVKSNNLLIAQKPILLSTNFGE